MCASVHVYTCMCVHVCMYLCMCVCACVPALLSGFSLMLLHLSTNFNLQSIFTCYILGDPQRESLKKLFFFSPHFAGGQTEAQSEDGLCQDHPAELGEFRISSLYGGLCHSPCCFPGGALQASREDASLLHPGPPDWCPEPPPWLAALNFSPISQVPWLPLASLFSELGATPSSLEIESFSTCVTAVFKRRA